MKKIQCKPMSNKYSDLCTVTNQNLLNAQKHGQLKLVI